VRDEDQETFNMPSVDEVLQEETDIPAVPVRIPDPVRVDRLPTIAGKPENFLLAFGASARPTKIARRDPTRSRITIVAVNKDIVVATTPEDARMFRGGIVSAGFSLPIFFEHGSELWAMAVNVNVTGTDVVLEPATDAALVSVFPERWAR
jgi:hypothetical protein